MQPMLCSNRRIIDPAACIQVMSAQLMPLYACRWIEPAVSTIPEAPSPTVGDKRGRLLTVRGSQPTESNTPPAEKHANPLGGISTKDYSPGECPTE